MIRERPMTKSILALFLVASLAPAGAYAQRGAIQGVLEPGPEVFVPDIPGAIDFIDPDADKTFAGPLRSRQGGPSRWEDLTPEQRRATRDAKFFPDVGALMRISPEARDRFMRGSPPASRIEDRRG